MANRYTPVSGAERQRMRSLRKQGLTIAAISRVVGRSYSSALVATQGITPHREPSPASVDRAMRMERLFASCNRALAEVRA
jgi:hypothetical protein